MTGKNAGKGEMRDKEDFPRQTFKAWLKLELTEQRGRALKCFWIQQQYQSIHFLKLRTKEYKCIYL